jgi:hypothetical protein
MFATLFAWAFCRVRTPWVFDSRDTDARLRHRHERRNNVGEQIGRNHHDASAPRGDRDRVS